MNRRVRHRIRRLLDTGALIAIALSVILAVVAAVFVTKSFGHS